MTEECFKSSPLRFTGSQALRWGGPDGRRENITGHFVTDSAPRGGLVGRLFDGIAVVPAGSIWAQNPIPVSLRHQRDDMQGRQGRVDHLFDSEPNSGERFLLFAVLP